jgi:hypothetical protein
MSILNTLRYMDPALGGMILQYLTAAFLTALLLTKKRIRKFKDHIKRYINGDE